MAVAARPTVNIRPGVSVLGVFKDMNYRTWYAIGEFVDNALQSYLENRDALVAAEGRAYRLTIDIETSDAEGGVIKVRDNAAGINSSRYQLAFVTAEPPPIRNGLSRYGIGMKSAACWFANKWSVRTTALGEDVERTLTFNVPEIIRRRVESMQPEERRVAKGTHYTEVRLWELHDERRDIFAGRTIGKVRLHLTSMYRRFLRREEVVLRFNGEELGYEMPKILEHAPVWAPKSASLEWSKDLNFVFGTGRRAHGFAALLAKGRRASAGFALLQNDRLIEGSIDDAYRPSEVFGGMESFRNLRLFGELQISGVGVAHTKDKFTWSDDVQADFLKALRRELDTPPLQLLRQADNLRVRTSEQVSEGGMERALDGAATALEALEPAVEEETHTPAVPMQPVPAPSRARDGELTRNLNLTVNDEAWRVTLELSKDPALSDWLFVGATEAGPAGVRVGGRSPLRRVLIRIALDHPFMNQWVTSYQTLEAVVRVAAGLAIAEVTAREAGATMPSTVRTHLNRYLRDALALPKALLTQDDAD